jgi:hypothetical protein
MNSRRGIVLAAIHLTVVAVIIVRTEADYWPSIRTERVRVRTFLPPSATAEDAMGVNFFPCDEGGIIDRPTAPREMVAGAANLPQCYLSAGMNRAPNRLPWIRLSRGVMAERELQRF